MMRGCHRMAAIHREQMGAPTVPAGGALCKWTVATLFLSLQLLFSSQHAGWNATAPWCKQKHLSLPQASCASDGCFHLCRLNSATFCPPSATLGIPTLLGHFVSIVSWTEFCPHCNLHAAYVWKQFEVSFLKGMEIVFGIDQIKHAIFIICIAKPGNVVLEINSLSWSINTHVIFCLLLLGFIPSVAYFLIYWSYKAKYLPPIVDLKHPSYTWDFQLSLFKKGNSIATIEISSNIKKQFEKTFSSQRQRFFFPLPVPTSVPIFHFIHTVHCGPF